MSTRAILAIAAVSAILGGPTTLRAADAFWGGDRMWEIKPSPTRIIVQFDSTSSAPQPERLLDAHPSTFVRSEPRYLSRGFYSYTLSPAITYDNAASILRDEPGIKRVQPAYIPVAGVAERIALDVVSARFPEHLSTQEIEEILARHGLRFLDSSLFIHNYWLCELDDTTIADPVDVGNALHSEDDVVWACAAFLSIILRTGQPTDPYYSAQYYLNNTGQFGGTPGIDIDADSAWLVTLIDSSIIVAVIDDGVTSHSDLEESRILQGFDAAGHIADERHYDFFPVPGDSQFHGMACAGILAAAHNDTGIVGVVGSSRIVPVKIFDDFGWPAATEWDVAQGIYFAALSGAKVISNSWSYGDSTSNADVWDAVKYATDPTHPDREHPSIMVFSSGNYADSSASQCVPTPWVFPWVCFPANMPEVIAVGAIRNTGWLWPYNCFGPALDVVAPSGGLFEIDTSLYVCSIGNVWTTDQEGDKGWNPTYFGALGDVEDRSYTRFFGGTSAACPQVAGIAALLLARSPWLINHYVEVPGTKLDDPDSIHAIKWIIRQSAVDIYLPGRDYQTGWGRASAYRALLAVMRGDVNNDAKIDAVDLQLLTDICFFGGHSPLDDRLGNANCDGVVNATDITYLVSHIYYGGPAPQICFRY